MEIVPDTGATSSSDATMHRRVRWAVVTIATVLVVANWRLVTVVLAIASALVVASALLVLVVLIRKATRPIAQLSMIDVAILTWLYRRREMRRASRHTDTSSNVRYLRPH